MRVDREADVAGNPVERRLEALVAERVDAAAVVADDVVVVLPVRPPGLVPRHALAELHALHEPELDEQLERPVDARDPDAPPVGAQAVVDLLRGQAARLGAKHRDDPVARAAAAEAGLAQRRAGVLAPLRHPPVHLVRVRHGAMITALILVRSRAMARIVLTFAAAALLGGCGGGGDGGANGEDGRTVVAAFYPLSFAAERVAAEGTAVRNLTPPGVEPHDFELSARDVRALADAEVVLYLGGGFQPALERALAATGARGVDLLDGLELLDTGAHGHRHEDDEHAEEAEDADEGADPHVWLDPVRYAAVVERVGAELGREDAAATLAAELRALHEELKAGLADCARRELVTSHAAFAYLADRYGLEQIAITGVSPEAEPTPGALRRVVEEVREHGATTVFFETLVSPRLARTVAREVGARTAVLNPLEGLTEEEAAAGADYFSVMRANLGALRRGLGCR